MPIINKLALLSEKNKLEEKGIPAETNSKLQDKTITPCQSSISRHAPKHPYAGTWDKNTQARKRLTGQEESSHFDIQEQWKE